MKSVLLSTRPKWCEKICHKIGTDKNGKPIYEKSIEVRKTKPSIPTPFKAFIYMTKKKPYMLTFAGNGKMRVHNGMVIGEFICDKVEEFSVGSLRSDDIEKLACLSYSEMIDYFYKPEELDGKTRKYGYGWHISQLKIYDKPKELSEFRKPLDRVWGSYCSDYCDPGCISFGSTDYSCNDYWDWEKGLTRPPQSWCYIQELEEKK